MRPLVDGPAEAGRVLRPGAVFAGLHQQLLRHAADIDAGAAPEPFLGDADACAVPRGDAGTAHAGGTTADHEQVIIHLSHPFFGATVCRGAPPGQDHRYSARSRHHAALLPQRHRFVTECLDFAHVNRGSAGTFRGALRQCVQRLPPDHQGLPTAWRIHFRNQTPETARPGSARAQSRRAVRSRLVPGALSRRRRARRRSADPLPELGRRRRPRSQPLVRQCLVPRALSRTSPPAACCRCCTTCTAGAAELRNPHPRFDAAWYADQHPEAAHNPLLHHLLVGARQGWLTEKPIDIRDYLPSTAAPFACPADIAVDVVMPVYRGLAATSALPGQRAGRSGPARPAASSWWTTVPPNRALSAWLDKLAAATRIMLLRNRRNLGFVGSVNRGMRGGGAARRGAAEQRHRGAGRLAAPAGGAGLCGAAHRLGVAVLQQRDDLRLSAQGQQPDPVRHDPGAGGCRLRQAVNAGRQRHAAHHGRLLHVYPPRRAGCRSGRSTSEASAAAMARRTISACAPPRRAGAMCWPATPSCITKDPSVSVLTAKRWPNAAWTCWRRAIRTTGGSSTDM